MPYGVNQSFQYLKKKHRSGVGLLLATYLHWNLIGTWLEPDWNLIGTSSWDKREKYKRDSGLTFGVNAEKASKNKNTNPKVCRGRDFQVLRLQGYNKTTNWPNILAKKCKCYIKTKKQGSERSDEVPAFTLYTLHLTPYTKQGSERSDEVPAFNLSPLTSNLKIVN